MECVRVGRGVWGERFWGDDVRVRGLARRGRWALCGGGEDRCERVVVGRCSWEKVLRALKV
ncbi:hypothetical protein [Bartonella bovis]|uniref:hypothetical protein n=1 Tax=Bartonella bovis TaxID=155194 RepID=UPI0011AF1D8A|nr:hypothetical protein [Bartonella bovis]